MTCPDSHATAIPLKPSSPPPASNIFFSLPHPFHQVFRSHHHPAGPPPPHAATPNRYVQSNTEFLVSARPLANPPRPDSLLARPGCHIHRRPDPISGPPSSIGWRCLVSLTSRAHKQTTAHPPPASLLSRGHHSDSPLTCRPSRTFSVSTLLPRASISLFSTTSRDRHPPPIKRTLDNRSTPGFHAPPLDSLHSGKH